MSSLNNKIKIDRANGAGQNASTGEEKMRNSSKKTPWHLRFAPGVILALAGILLALPGGEIQVQCAEFDPNDCANPCYMPPPPQPQPQGPRIFMPGTRRGWNAIDLDCDTVYDEKITELTKTRDDAIKAANDKYSSAIQNATKNYKLAVELENTIFNGDMARADAEFLWTLETECSAYTLTDAVTTWGGSIYVGKKAFQKIRVRAMAILRSGALLVGGVATSVICVGAEQRVYDATTESLMVTHALKLHQLFEAWRQALADAKATRNAEIRDAHNEYNKLKPRIDRQYRNCKRFFRCDEEEEGTNDGDCGVSDSN